MQSNNNGNNQLNTERDNINTRISNLYIVGRSKRVAWNNRGRFRTI